MTSLKFDKKLYNIDAVKQAAQTYKEWADFNIKEEKKEIEVNISSEQEEEEIIRDEFANYVLALMKSIDQ